jgi:nucleotide-binding universal stress UspA family protein
MVVPHLLLDNAAALAETPGWEVEGWRQPGEDDVTAALTASAQAGLALYVPPAAADVPLRLDRVLVPHDGTPNTAASLSVASGLALRGRTEVVVLHVIETDMPDQAGTLPAPRMLDHDGDDWVEWREEFGRRFFNGSPTTPRRLEVAVGSRSAMILRAARTLPADLIVMAWGGVLEAGRARTLRSVCCAAPCPVLLVASRRQDDSEMRTPLALVQAS